MSNKKTVKDIILQKEEELLEVKQTLIVDLSIAVKVDHSIEELFIRNSLESIISELNFIDEIKKAS